jgi:dTDP-4-amino-4,6-dideoxygalactose transaminase
VHEKSALLAFPIVFENTAKATEAYQALTASGFFIRRWYSPLLYPGPAQNRYYYYESRMAPIAEDISARILCLPTNYSAVDTRKIIKILNPVENPVQKNPKSVEKSKK